MANVSVTLHFFSSNSALSAAPAGERGRQQEFVRLSRTLSGNRGVAGMGVRSHESGRSDVRGQARRGASQVYAPARDGTEFAGFSAALRRSGRGAGGTAARRGGPGRSGVAVASGVDNACAVVVEMQYTGKQRGARGGERWPGRSTARRAERAWRRR